MKHTNKYLAVLIAISILLCSVIAITSSAANSSQGDNEAEIEELQPMVANRCGYTSINQMQHLIDSGQAPSTITHVHDGFQGQQPHVHFSDGTAMNFDGSAHHGNPQPTAKVMEWLNSHGWCIL